MPAELEELLHDVRQAWGADVEVDDDLLAQLFVPKAGVWAGVPTVDHYRHLRVGDEP